MIDLTYLSKLMGGNELLVQKFVGIFKIQAPEQVNALEGEIESGNWENVSGIAHSLKSQFEYMGLNSLAEQMLRIEDLADNNDTESISGLYNIFKKEFTTGFENAFSKN